MSALDGCISFSLEQLHSLNSSIARHGWKQGFEQFTQELPERLSRELRNDISLRHMGLTALLSPSSSTHVLVFENGIGSAAISLAGDYEGVTALYPSDVQASIARQRISHLGLANVTVLSGLDELGTILRTDAIVFIGTDMASLDTQDLDRLRRLVRETDACLFIGFRAHRSGSLAFLNAFFKSAKELEPGESFDFYRYHGAKTGFYKVSVVRRGGYFSPRQIALLPSAEALAMVRNPPGSENRWDAAIRILRKSVADPNVQRSEARDFFLSRPRGLTVLTERIHGAQAVCKLALDVETEHRLNTNFRTLEPLSNAPFAASLPTPIASTRVGRTSIFAESALVGKPIGRKQLTTESSYHRILIHASHWLTSLQSSRRIVKMDKEMLERLVVDPSQRAANLFPVSSHGALREISDFLSNTLYEQELPLVLSHGDFSIDNVLMSGSHHREVAGVIDWDLATPESLPLVDLLYFIATAEATRTSRQLGSVFADKIIAMRYRSIEQREIENYCRTLKVPVVDLFPLSVLSWIYHLAFRLQHGEIYCFSHLYKQAIEPPFAAVMERIRGAKSCSKTAR